MPNFDPALTQKSRPILHLNPLEIGRWINTLTQNGKLEEASMEAKDATAEKYSLT
jgi:hypothetical protein